MQIKHVKIVLLKENNDKHYQEQSVFSYKK